MATTIRVCTYSLTDGCTHAGCAHFHPQGEDQGVLAAEYKRKAAAGLKPNALCRFCNKCNNPQCAFLHLPSLPSLPARRAPAQPAPPAKAPATPAREKRPRRGRQDRRRDGRGKPSAPRSEFDITVEQARSVLSRARTGRCIIEETVAAIPATAKTLEPQAAAIAECQDAFLAKFAELVAGFHESLSKVNAVPPIPEEDDGSE